jgi:AraC-like DNA-binding protein
MLFEPTTLAAAAKVIAETLEGHYAVDPVGVFADAGLEYGQLSVSEARYPWSSMQRLWTRAVEVTEDPCLGLYVGRHIRPTSFHALGFSWLSSESLLGSLERLCRYYRVISTVPVELSIQPARDRYIFFANIEDPAHVPTDAAVDSFMLAIVQLCRTATNAHFHPMSVALRRIDPGHIDEYVKAFNCPVSFEAARNQIHFDKESLERRLPGDNRALARANDAVAEKYLDSLDPQKVASEVRELLIALLPSGKSSQKTIATRLNRSLSTLQRQLQREGTNYKDILDHTRKKLATEYVADNNLSLGQIAYMLGFSDQSNFSRAFKRWTDSSPREYRRAHVAANQ